MKRLKGTPQSLLLVIFMLMAGALLPTISACTMGTQTPLERVLRIIGVEDPLSEEATRELDRFGQVYREYATDPRDNERLEYFGLVERTDLYAEHEEDFRDQIKRCATVHGNLVVLDLREEATIFAGNRFMIYALFPDANISIHILWGLNKLNTVFATGKSILDRRS